jgi:hypothetical protein
VVEGCAWTEIEGIGGSRGEGRKVERKRGGEKKVTEDVMIG